MKQDISTSEYRKLRNIAGEHNMGSNLLLRVSPSTSQATPDKLVRSWILRFEFRKRTIVRGLGSEEELSLAQARKMARDWKGRIKAGEDPREAVRQSLEDSGTAERTVRALFARWVEFREAKQDSDKDVANCRGRFKNHIDRFIGDKDVEEVTPSDIAVVLTPLYLGATGTAKKVRGDLNGFFGWAIARGLRSAARPTDPQVLRHLLPRADQWVGNDGNYPACPVEDLPRFVAMLTSHETTRTHFNTDCCAFDSVSRMALLFSILTASRGGNVRTHVKKYKQERYECGAVWEDFSEDLSLWTIPSKKMKEPGNPDHIVPLSRQAQALLWRIRALGISSGTGPVFVAGGNGRPVSETMFRHVIESISRKDIAQGGSGFLDPENGNRLMTQHATSRRTFHRWAESHGYPVEWIEKSLHHWQDRLKNAYDGNPLTDQRRKLMQDWADYCLSESEPDWDRIDDL